MDGILNVLKPPGMTSHDVVAYLRRVLKTKKAGHGGTLDPDAAGVLPVFIGSATRLLEFAVEGRKQYLVEITLGQQTDTGDDSGAVVKTMPVPQLTRDEVLAVLQRFTGKLMQTPPMYSALKVDGQKLYALARQGIDVARKARPIEVYSLELLHQRNNYLTLAVECSKGTYIRVLGEDIAAALGTCGTMSFLLRTQVAGFKIEEAFTLQEIAAAPEKCLAAPLSAVSNIPKLVLTARQAERITNGVRTTVVGTTDGRYVLMGPTKEFLGIGSCSEEKIQAEKIFSRYIMQEE